MVNVIGLWNLPAATCSSCVVLPAKPSVFDVALCCHYLLNVNLNAVIQLLQSSGLEWFDSIADNVLSEFRCTLKKQYLIIFESEEDVDLAHGDYSSAEALHILWQGRIGVVAVVNRENMEAIG
ncbi:hypothetical protein SADUNF_Sadunf04G0112300 [Salix dunnii]|uniref:Uncharacterized protein n=1 Tax=Salix dunnii TaxID=1413687 RepID=A0A835N0Y0_9ROSI|nr:hypothetical protein SADUNF_Sadunf04G0112300 [Salix dunnii]